MKRYILLLTLLILTVELSFGQLTYHGTISGNTTWNAYDFIYIDGDVYIAPSGNLTISPNTSGSNPVHVVFLGNHVIKVDGAINVNGTSSRNIIFTADRDNDQVYGESGETWQNISFLGPTGTSVINNAIIEFGTGDEFSSGGGIDVYGSNITVRNSIIRNCNLSSPYGGALYVEPFDASTVTLENLILYNNTSSGGGAGVYFAAAGSLKNSLIYNHTGTGVYFSSGGSIVNCSIINNSTGVISASGTAPVLLNTILWGNGTEYSGSNIALANCGIEGGYTVGTNGGGNIDLNSTNGDATGPNFVSTSSPDLHIGSWITPLVDGGISSYSGVTAPGTDKDGNSRISTIDIGAYEFIYYRWTGAANTTDWSTSGNWDGSPSSVPTSFTENQVIIPNGCDYYPIASSITLSSRSRVVVEPEAGLTVTGATTVSTGCTFQLQSDATGSANFISGSSVSGSFNIQLYLTGGSDPTYNWHYVTTPVNGHSKTALTNRVGNANNLLNYLESAVTTDKNAGWQWHDGYNSTTAFSNLYTTRGYNVLLRNLSDRTALFTGTILSGQDFVLSNDVDLTCGTGDANQRGWNLIGNPFTAGVDLETFTFGANVDRTIYFTTGNSYLSYNTATHEGTNGATNRIPGMQGFFVHATEGSGKSLTIPASGRDYSTSSLYKGEQATVEFPLLKFNISDGPGFSDEALVYFFKDATARFDRNYDAYKMLSENPGSPQIYTISDNIKLAMNGLPYPETKTIVPLNIRIGESKNYTINILDLKNLSEYNVFLVHGDKKIDLKTSSGYSFYAASGILTDMSITFESISTDVNPPLEEQATIWYLNGNVMIKAGETGFEDNTLVVIHDLNGKVVYRSNNIKAAGGEINELPVRLPKGMYLVSVLNKYKKSVTKIVVPY